MSELKDRCLLAVIGDQDTVTGLLLSGVGHVNAQSQKNFLVVDSKTPVPTIEGTFKTFYSRKDIAVILINQHVADLIRPLIDDCLEPVPTVLEIPSKEHPYDPEKDSVLKRVNKLFNAD